MKKIVLFDYGVGNLHSLGKALARHGHTVNVERDARRIAGEAALVLPGVGAFGPAAAALAPQRDHILAALADGLPCLAICLGMQLLFERSEESEGAGLGWIAGSVRRLNAPRVPQMGWNAVETSADPLFDDVTGLVAWYANSYVCEVADPTAGIARSQYMGDHFAAGVRRGNTWGVQFHPEKSAAAGLRIIDNFLDCIE
jgi:glutamine amidotransferase